MAARAFTRSGQPAAGSLARRVGLLLGGYLILETAVVIAETPRSGGAPRGDFSSATLATARSNSVFAYSVAALTGAAQSADSWGPMDRALDILRTADHAPVYEALFFTQREKFQYPLTSLFVVAPFHADVAHEPDTARLAAQARESDALRRVSWIALWTVATLAAALMGESARQSAAHTPAPVRRVDTAVLLAVAGCATLTFYPVVKAYSLGQVQLWLDAIVAALLWLWLRGHEGAAGALAGLLALVKPQYALLGVWAALRRRWTFAGSALTVGAVGLLVAIATYGLHQNMEYIDVLRFIARHGEAYYPNQSVNGFLNRLLSNGSNLDFQAHDYAPYNRWVYAGTVLAAVGLIGYALVPRRTADRISSTADLAILLVSCTIASPVAWEHHYGILLPVFAFLVPVLARRPVFGRWTMPLLAVSYVLAASLITAAQRLAPTHWNVLQSYLLIGALLALVLLYGSERALSSEQLVPSP